MSLNRGSADALNVRPKAGGNTVITYADFIANADAEDIRVMNLLSMGQRLEFVDDTEAEAMFARIARLDGAGFIIEATRKFQRRDGALWQMFDAVIEPAAAAYLARAAAERVQLSREVLP
jgi:hypothetical protein